MFRDEIFWGLKFRDENDRGQKVYRRNVLPPMESAASLCLFFYSALGFVVWKERNSASSWRGIQILVALLI